MNDWNGKEISTARSKGGVRVAAHPYDNLISTGCKPWPPSEIVQKMYQSRQVRAFTGDDLSTCKSGIDYYCDLQSLHSEDAITWSVFGTAARSGQLRLTAWLNDLFGKLGLTDIRTGNAEIFLWRRIPHPDNLVPGGPEIDVGISTENAIVFVEAKWQSGVGLRQGKKKDKDQIQLRVEFLNRYGLKVFPNRPYFVVLGISHFPNAFKQTVSGPVIFKTTTWETVCSLDSHPLAAEVQRYFEWKTKNTIFKECSRKNLL